MVAFIKNQLGTIINKFSIMTIKTQAFSRKVGGHSTPRAYKSGLCGVKNRSYNLSICTVAS